MKIAQLKDKMNKVEIEGRLIELEDTQEVTSKKTGKIFNKAKGVIADTSGKVAVIFWEKDIEKVHVGDTITITNGYVTSFREEIQVNIGLFGVLTVS